MDPRLDAALLRVRDEVSRRHEGPTPEALAGLTAFGKEAFQAVLLPSRSPGPAEGIDAKTQAENWYAVLFAFAGVDPRWLGEPFNQAAPGVDLSALVWVLGRAPNPPIPPDLLRWLG